MRVDERISPHSPPVRSARGQVCAGETSPAWDPELLARYDTRGPRYTSYPGAHMFNTDFGVEQYGRALQAAGCSQQPLSLYVHIPFCEDICYYCACNKIVTRDHSRAAKYLDYLNVEASLIAEQIGGRRVINALHFGGGTPNFLDMGELTKLIFQLSGHFILSDAQDREFSIELDPRMISPDTLGLLKGLGFNRLSMGVQDFDPAVQDAINRRQSFQKVAALVDAARRYEFRSMNFDLIYGLPKQSSESFARTIAQVLQLRPDRIALYNYAHLPQRFSSQRAIDRQQLPSAEEKLQMLCQVATELQDNGYRYIGMDHFALEDDELCLAADTGRLQRSFQGYSVSHTDDIIALGMSAISSLGSCYAQNHKDLEAYYAALEQGSLPVALGLSLNDDDVLRRELINQLICQLSLDVPALERRYGIDFEQYFAAALPGLEKAERDGLLSRSDSGIKVNETGRLLLRNICMLFDNYLGEAAGRFSRTI